MASILLVEDDRTLLAELTSFLNEYGYAVDPAENGAQASSLMAARSYSLCILDLGLPDCSGLSLCRSFRKHFSNPIIILTAFDSDDDIIAGLEAGADDYVTKPCSFKVLLSRIASQLRRKNRGNRSLPKTLFSGDLVIDLIHCSIFRNQEALPVSNIEYKLCLALAKSEGLIMPRNLLLDKIWDASDRFIEDNTLSVHMSRLRKKLGQYGGRPYIETIKGIGYRWNIKVMENSYEDTAN